LIARHESQAAGAIPHPFPTVCSANPAPLPEKERSTADPLTRILNDENAMLEQFIANWWNRLVPRAPRPARGGLELGRAVVDGQLRQPVFLPHNKRAEHISLLGKTGQGKSSLIRKLASQDIAAGRGFLLFDLHGDLTPYTLSFIAGEEQRLNEDLSDKLILIDPADPEYSVGLNVLEAQQRTRFSRSRSSRKFSSSDGIWMLLAPGPKNCYGAPSMFLSITA